MSLGDRVGSLFSKVRSIVFLTVSDHPENGGITGDLDPEDWSDDEETDPDDRPEGPADGPNE